jgi:ATP-binding cassette, subfamily C (CFTR/MRP), member 1
MPSSIWRALFYAFGRQYLYAGLHLMVSDLLLVIQPLLFRSLIRFVSDYQHEKADSKSYGFLIGIGLLVLLIGRAISMNQHEYHREMTSVHVRAAMTAAIYDKATRLSNAGRSKNSSGTVLNHIAVDIQRIEGFLELGHLLWSNPLKIVLIGLCLYQLLGLSMLLGLLVLILLVPMNTSVQKYVCPACLLCIC